MDNYTPDPFNDNSGNNQNNNQNNGNNASGNGTYGSYNDTYDANYRPSDDYSNNSSTSDNSDGNNSSDNNYYNNNAVNPASTAGMANAQNSSGTWVCAKCGKINNSRGDFCVGCGARKPLL